MLHVSLLCYLIQTVNTRTLYDRRLELLSSLAMWHIVQYYGRIHPFFLGNDKDFENAGRSKEKISVNLAEKSLFLLFLVDLMLTVFYFFIQNFIDFFPRFMCSELDCPAIKYQRRCPTTGGTSITDADLSLEVSGPSWRRGPNLRKGLVTPRATTVSYRQCMTLWVIEQVVRTVTKFCHIILPSFITQNIQNMFLHRCVHLLYYQHTPNCR